MPEVWKDIEGFEGRYEVSDQGRVRSLDYMHTGIKTCLVPVDSKGYGRIFLYPTNGPRKKFSVHRLVAKAFLPNPENKPLINHKFGLKKDSRASQIEWVTHKENSDHAVKVLGIRQATGSYSPHAQAYLATSPEGIVLAVLGLKAFCDIKQLDRRAMLRVAKGQTRHHKGWKLSYREAAQ